MSYTSERSTPSLFDVSYDEDNVPQRELSDFIVTRGDEKISICALDEAHSSEPIIAKGVISSRGTTLRVKSAPLVEWCIEYSNEPRLWIRSDSVWYKLMRPAKEYARTHDLARKRFELCARIFILLTTLNPDECTFRGIAHLLSHPYMQMRGYTDKEILSERDFILTQFRTLYDPAIANAQFVRELRSKKTSHSKKSGNSSGGAAGNKSKKDSQSGSSLRDPSTPQANGHADSNDGWQPAGNLDAEGNSKLLKRVERALGIIMKNNRAYPFCQPVDPEQDGCPDYFDRIAKPMDYGTIKERLEAKGYSSVIDIMDDFRQVTRNCIYYNGDDHDFSQWAVSLESKFETLLRTAEEAEIAAMVKRNPSKKRRASDGPPSSKSGAVAKKPSKVARRSNNKSSPDRSPSSESPVKEEEALPKKICVRSETQNCSKVQAPNSKYCSSDCGLIVARQRLAELHKAGFNPEEYVRAHITKALVHSRS